MFQYNKSAFLRFHDRGILSTIIAETKMEQAVNSSRLKIVYSKSHTVANALQN